MCVVWGAKIKRVIVKVGVIVVDEGCRVGDVVYFEHGDWIV